MSHVIDATTSAQQTLVHESELDCLRKAVEKLGGVWKEGQTHYRTWASDNGPLVGDYPLPEGMSEQDVGKCTHAIGLNNKAKSGPQAYEVGVVESSEHPGYYGLVYDFYGGAIDSQFSSKDDQGRQQHDLGHLMAEFHLEAARQEAEAQGDQLIIHENEEGDYELEIDTTARLGY